MQMGDEDFGLKTTADWLKLYRKFIAVPEHERNGTGPTFVNGIDVLRISDRGTSSGLILRPLRLKRSRPLFVS